ncbi:hypothetical protein ACLOJK_003486 [Asimina triloba]
MYSEFDRIENAFDVFRRIGGKDFACGGLLQVEHGKQIHGLSIKFGYGGDHVTGCSLCNMYAKCRNLESARNAFSQIDRPDLASWNDIIAGFAYQEEINNAMFLLSRMKKLGLKSDHITIRCLLCACTCSAALSQGQQIHSYLVKSGLDLNISVCNALLTMYAKCSELCRISIGTVLSACANLATLEIGNQVHGHAFKTGLAFDLSIVNGLIDMYSKCRSLVDARKLFELMKIRDASMKSKGVMKVPGQSWIKIRDQDQLHPDTDEIYVMLGELQMQITEADYIYPAKDMLLVMNQLHLIIGTDEIYGMLGELQLQITEGTDEIYGMLGELQLQITEADYNYPAKDMFLVNTYQVSKCEVVSCPAKKNVLHSSIISSMLSFWSPCLSAKDDIPNIDPRRSSPKPESEPP